MKFNFKNSSIKNFCILLLLLIPFALKAQQQNDLSSDAFYQKAIKPEVKTMIVDLAQKNTKSTVLYHQEKIAKYQVGKASWSWLNLIGVAGNLNEYSLKPPQTNIQYTPYPRYNFGISLPLGALFTNGKDVKIAKENLEIAKEQETSTAAEIKAQVLNLYEDYLMDYQLLASENKIIETVYTAYIQAEQKFTNGEISLDDYNNSIRSYSNEQQKKVGLQHDLNVTQNNIEQLIGTDLIHVIQQQPLTNQ